MDAPVNEINSLRCTDNRRDSYSRINTGITFYSRVILLQKTK